MSQTKTFATAILRAPVLVCVLLLLATAASPQTCLNSTGGPTFSTPMAVEQGFLNLANGNLHIEIALGTFPQRGHIPYTAKLVYDSRIWQPVFNGTSTVWQPTNVANSQGGWRFVTTADGGTVVSVIDQQICGDDIHFITTRGPFTWTEPDGTSHTFPIYTQFVGPGCGGTGVTGGNAFAIDSTGYHMYVTGYIAASVYSRDGRLVRLPNGQLRDTNGNYVTQVSGNVVDTLNRTPVMSTTNGNTTTYSVLNSQGGTSNFTVTTTAVNYNTAFGQSAVTEASGSFTAIQSIALPDGTSYNFTYDSGTTAGNYGLLKTMQLPTGGTITYTHTTFSDSYGTKNRWLNTRTAGGGQWVYAPQVISACPGGCQQKVTVSNPAGDQTVHTFTLNNGAWNTQTQSYTGLAASGTLLQTVTTDYDMALNAYIRPIRVTTTVPGPGGNLSRKTEYIYSDVYVANVTASKEWNFYFGTPPVAPDRERDTAYLTDANYLANEIRNRPLSITALNSAGVQVAQTNYTYDSTPLTSATGITHHDDTGYGTGNTYRGNPTVMQKWVGGTTYLTETKYYDTTGQLVQWTDTNGNNTFSSYADVFYTDNGANPPATFTPSAPTNAYLTQKTEPLIGAKTYGYYFNTGKQARTVDQNGADSYQHYLDPRDRLTHSYTPPILGASRGWTLVQYTSATQQDTYSSINDTTPSPTCSSCRHGQRIVDGLGRVIKNTLASDPQGATATDSGYDSSSRMQSVSNPYRSTSDPTYGLSTTSYDGINRAVTSTRPDSNIARAYFGAGVTPGGGIGTQLCSSATYGLGYPGLTLDEAGKKKQSWMDGYGRIIEDDEPDATNNLTIATCHKYNVLNNLTTVVKGSQTRTYSYDGLSRKTQEVLPESGTTNYYYTTAAGGLCSGDPDGICRRTDARNITTTYAYDALHRLTSKTYSDSTPAASFFYEQTTYNGLTITNGKGRRTGMSDGSGQTAWSYDAGGSVLAERRTISGITKSTTYTYNLAGSVASITYPTGHVVSYGYNNAGRQISVTDSGSGINYALSATYAPQGAIAGAVHGQVSGGFTGITRTYAYNNRLEPNTKVASSSNGTVQNLTYSFNLGGGVNNGNVASITNNVNANRTQSYTYDSQNRLGTAQSQAASGVDCWGQSFGYDQYGNLLSITATKCSAPSLSVSVNNSNQITNTGFTYDAAGNMTNDGSQAYAWDADNRLTSGAGTTYTYDGDGWRRKSSVGKLYWNDSGCGNPVLMETDLTGGSAQEFIYLNKQRIARREASGTILYYFDDHLESARVMTDATGHTMQESDYYPYWRGAGDHRHAGQPLQVQREAARLGDGSGP